MESFVLFPKTKSKKKKKKVSLVYTLNPRCLLMFEFSTFNNYYPQEIVTLGKGGIVSISKLIQSYTILQL